MSAPLTTQTPVRTSLIGVIAWISTHQEWALHQLGWNVMTAPMLQVAPLWHVPMLQVKIIIIQYKYTSFLYICPPTHTPTHLAVRVSGLQGERSGRGIEYSHVYNILFISDYDISCPHFCIMTLHTVKRRVQTDAVSVPVPGYCSWCPEGVSAAAGRARWLSVITYYELVALYFAGASALVYDEFPTHTTAQVRSHLFNLAAKNKVADDMGGQYNRMLQVQSPKVPVPSK